MRRRSLLAAPALAAATPPAASSKALEVPRRVFGQTGERLSIIGQAGGRFPLISFEDAVAVTKRAYDLGLNYFDNAHSYWNGRSEEVYGAALAGVRRKCFITSKSTQRKAADATRELELTLKRMKTDYVDLWQIHAVSEMAEVNEIFGPGGAIEAFEKAKKEGKCRFIGFTGHRDPYVHLEMLKRYDKYDTILMPLHMADPSYLSFEKLVLPVAVKRGLGIQGMKSTANSKLLQNFSFSECLRYTLSLPIHCLAVGCTSIGQIEDDVRVAASFKPYAETELAGLRERASRLKGPGLEDWKRDITRADARNTYAGG